MNFHILVWAYLDTQFILWRIWKFRNFYKKLWRTFAILWKYFEKKLYCHKFSVSREKKKLVEKITQNCHNCLQHESVLKIFLLSYFEYRQIWLNITLDDLATWATSQIWKKKNFSHHYIHASNKLFRYIHSLRSILTNSYQVEIFSQINCSIHQHLEDCKMGLRFEGRLSSFNIYTPVWTQVISKNIRKVWKCYDLNVTDVNNSMQWQ